MSWTLEHNGVEKPFDKWGIENAHRDTQSQGNDRFGFDLTDKDADAPEVFAFGDEIIVRHDGTTCFIGYRHRELSQASAQMELLSYQFTGFWEHFFTRLPYQQYWSAYDDYVSTLNLMQSNLGVNQSTAATFADVIQFVADQTEVLYGSPKFQPGAGMPVVYPPIDQISDISCEQAMQKVMRWCPDAVIWTDYTTTPPTINVKAKADLTPVSLSAFDGEFGESMQMERRHDQVVSVVQFNYRQTAEIDGQQIVAVYKDKFPVSSTGREFGGVMNTFDYEGLRVTYARSTIATEVVNAKHADTATRLAWWRAALPHLADDTRVTDLVIEVDGVTIGGASSLPNRLTAGAIFPWMEKQFERVTIKALAKYVLKDGAGHTLHDFTKNPVPLNIQIDTTDAESGNYSTIANKTAPEDLPFGLAEMMFNAWNAAEYQGSFTLIEEEITGPAGVGNVLNFSDGRPEWATMNALIQSVSYDVDQGRTTLNVGPTPFLSASDLIEKMRAGRQRGFYNNPLARTSSAAGTNEVMTGGKTANSIADQTPAQGHMMAMIDGTKKIVLDASVVPDGATVALTELPICIAGVQKHILVPCYGPY